MDKTHDTHDRLRFHKVGSPASRALGTMRRFAKTFKYMTGAQRVNKGSKEWDKEHSERVSNEQPSVGW